MRELARESFTPSEAWHAAFNLWQSLQANGGHAEQQLVDRALPYLGSAEARGRKEIDALGKTFFTLSPAKRRDALNQLVERYECFPALAGRLAELQYAVDVDLNALAGERQAVRDLAGHLCELYSLPRSQRGVQKHRPSPKWIDTLADWPLAAAEIRRRYPSIARLDLPLLEEIQTSRERARQLAKIRRRRERRAAIASMVDRIPDPFATLNQNGSWTGLVGFLALIFMFGAVGFSIQLDQSNRTGSRGYVPGAPRTETERKLEQGLMQMLQEQMRQRQGQGLPPDSHAPPSRPQAPTPPRPSVPPRASPQSPTPSMPAPPTPGGPR